MKRIVLVGFGDIAQTAHLPALLNQSEFEMVSVVEIDSVCAQKASAAARVPVFSTIEEAMQTNPTAAIVCTPPHITPAIVVKALQLDLHVLVEKPIAVTRAAASEISSAAKSAKKVVQIGFVNRFAPFIIETKRLIDTGLLGKPLMISMGAFDEALNEKDSHHFKKVMGFLEHGSSFAHEGTHLLDYLRFFQFGEPRRISALGMRSDSRFPSENWVYVNLSFGDGSLANLEVGWMTKYLPKGYIRITGPLGRIEIIRRDGRMWFENSDGIKEYPLGQNWDEITFASQLLAFASNIDQGAWSGATAEDGLWNVELISKIEDKLRQEREAIS